MKNCLQREGDIIRVAAPRNVSAGDGVLVGKIFGVAATTATSGSNVELYREGVYLLAKTSAQAWNAGDAVYWDDTAHVCTTTATGNYHIGSARDAAANPSATGAVILSGHMSLVSA